jgi:hypothetical protein
MFNVGDEAGEDARHGRGLLNVRPVPGSGDAGGLRVRKSAGDFIADQFAGGEGVVAGDQQRRRSIGEGLVPSGWPAVHAWSASSAVSAGVVGVAATSAAIASGDGDTINAFLPAAATVGSLLRATLFECDGLLGR